VARFATVALFAAASLGLVLGQPSNTYAQRNLAVSPAAKERRVALVIGNDNYHSVAKLERAAADARAVGAELKRLGFDVLLRTNVDRRGMNAAVGDLVDKAGHGGVALLFFAGHGVQVSGSNYLLPTDIKVGRADDLPDEAIDLGRVMERLAQAKTKFSLLIIDACRDNPFPRAAGRSLGGARGLSIPSAPDGLMVLYSAGINEQALDKLSDADANPNSVFTREFVKELKTPWRRVDDMLRRVRVSVREQARSVGHSQNPALYDQSSADFYFAQPPKAATQTDRAAFELAYWQTVKDTRNADELKAFLSEYPNSRFSQLALARLTELAPPPTATSSGLPGRKLGVFAFSNERESSPVSVRDVALQNLHRLDDFHADGVEAPSPAASASSNFEFDYAKWGSSFDLALVGATSRMPDGRYDVVFRLLDLRKRIQLAGARYAPTAQGLRHTGHLIADKVVEAVIGVAGPFQSRILYVARTGNVYDLRMADYDGHDRQTLLRSNRPILTPAWSPDHSRVAYISLEKEGSPSVYVHDMHAGTRRLIASVSEKAVLAWGPTSNELLLADSDGNSSTIKLLSLEGRLPKDVAPIRGVVEGMSSTTDGSTLLVVQYQGSSELYAFTAPSPMMERIPVEEQGTISSAAFMPGARQIALVARGRDEDRLLVLDRYSGQLKLVLRAPDLTSVTVSPDGKLLGAVRTVAGSSQITHVSKDGKTVGGLGFDGAKHLAVVWAPKR
jgi:tol-pal system beta propeller repeat protein TolB